MGGQSLAIYLQVLGNWQVSVEGEVGVGCRTVLEEIWRPALRFVLEAMSSSGLGAERQVKD
jgi:hypothetical protein